MFRHNLLLSYRTFRRFKTSFFINLIGLSTGLACALLIYLWVNDELSVDKFHEKDDRLFQVMQNQHDPNGIQTIEPTPGLLAETLSEEMPEVQYAVAVIPPRFPEGIASVDDKRFKVSRQFAGKDFFNVFSYELIQGDKSQVLSNKNAVVISKDLAFKLFQTTENVIGRVIALDEPLFTNKSGLYHVSGVFKNIPNNATTHFDLLLSYELFLEHYSWVLSWENSYPNTYTVLKEGTSASFFNHEISNLIQSKYPESKSTLLIRKYSDRYLYGRYENGVQTGGRIEYVRLFSLIAIFILITACINFMNLSTAKASRRLKEVGVKKTLGAGRKTLVFQYLGESLLMTFLSLIMALLIVGLFLPQFNQITGKQLVLNFDATLILSILGITLFTGLISGSYPALYLSGFNPVTVLKGKLNTSACELWTRKGLVVFQFTLSVILIVSVLVVYKQMELVQSKNLGYDKDNIIYFDTEAINEAFMNGIKSVPGVVNASRFYHDMTGRYSSTSGLEWEGKNPDEVINFAQLQVGYDFVETLGMEMAAGRTFSRDFGSEKQLIFNEIAIEKMVIEDPVGKTVKFWNEDWLITGVVKNFHFESLYEEVKPCFLHLTPMTPMTTKVMVKIQTGMVRETLDQLEEFYHQYNPDFPFDYQFLDEDYKVLYNAEQRVSTLSKYFAGLAILISCLGLFGLAAFTAERRLKEIGIRKILGSSEFGIVYLLSGDFTKMVLIAIMIAMPVSYLLAKNWLEGFAYRIDLAWWFFIAAALLALFIAWFTVGLQTVKAASINLVECLKDE